MQKEVIVFFFFSLLLCSCYFSIGQNLAYQKSYTLSTDANYGLSGNRDFGLTDGNVCTDKGRFWASSCSTGWQYVSRVHIELDLGNVDVIGDVSLGTARGEISQVNYPKHVFVFVSSDGENYVYVGDVVRSPRNSTGSYQVSNFSLREIDVSARYIRLVVVPNGKFFFCDEIQVLRGGIVRSFPNEESIPKDRLDVKVNSIIELNNRAASLAIDLPTDELRGTSSFRYIEEAEFKKKMDRLRLTKTKHNTPYIIQRVNPWINIPIDAIPDVDTQRLNFNFSVIYRGVQYGAILVTNNTDHDLSVKVSTHDEGLIQFFHAPRISSPNSAYLIDPLVPLQRNEFTLEYGANSVLFFKVAPIEDSVIPVVIEADHYLSTFDVSVRVYNSFKGVDQLNVNTWAYLHYPMLKGREEEAVLDLSEHHNNVTVVSSHHIPSLKSVNFSSLIEYLSFFPKTNKVILFSNFRDKSRKAIENSSSFMSTQWKFHFSSWYKKMLFEIENAGIDPNQVYWYPYDELEPSEISDFISFSSWAREYIPGFRLFVTLDHGETLTVLPHTDIAQVSSHLFSRYLIPQSATEIWTYDVLPNSREQLPYDKYRLMAWRAYLFGYKGIGFWNYASFGKEARNSIAVNIDPHADYGVIYDSEDGSILSSRRWESFRLGVEDYYIIKLYERKFGRHRAQSLVNDVVCFPGDNQKADVIRDQMLRSLYNG